MNVDVVGDPSLVSSPEVLESLKTLGEVSHQLSVEHFFKLPEKTSFQISKHGSYYAFLAPWKRRMNIFVASIENGGEKILTQFEDRNISSFAWASDDRILFIKDNGGDENFHLWTIGLNDDTPRDLTPFDGVRCELINMLVEDDDHVLISLNKNNPQVFDPYRLNIKTGELTQLAKNNDPTAPIVAYMADHKGRLRVASQLIDGVVSVLLYRDSEEEPFREILRTDYKTEVRPLFFDFEEDHILWVASNLNRDKSALIKFDAQSGQELGPVIFEHPNVDVSQAGYSRQKQKVTTVSYVTDRSRYHFMDEDRAKLQRRLESALGGLQVAVVSGTYDEDQFIVRSFSDRSLGAYYLYDGRTDELKSIAEVSPWINEDDMCHHRPISYTSRDGLTIHGYLTLPRDYKGGPLPFVINPHGGPWHRDVWGFNPEVQLFASRGYGVLQMNFRGSTGYGRAFWEASFKQWGQNMQDDITDGVHWLIEEGLADKDLIAIYGGSYGGYATLAGVCYTPDLYCCAMDYVGVSNLFTFMKTIPPYWEPYLKMMYEMVGHPEKDREMMTQFSPALNADKIKVPLFVIQGANDPRVNIDESDQMVRSLRSRKIEVPYMVKYDEGHGFRNEENQFEVYKCMLGFLQKHLKAK